MYMVVRTRVMGTRVCTNRGVNVAISDDSVSIIWQSMLLCLPQIIINIFHNHPTITGYLIYRNKISALHLLWHTGTQQTITKDI